MNVVFLDVDGVLNSNDFYMKRGRGRVHDKFIDDIDKEAVAVLNNVIEETNAFIVLSSSWRLGLDDELSALHVKKMGVKGRCLGRTPSLGHSRFRGEEIHKWLEESQYPVKNIVILDDDSDMLHLGPHHIKTSWKTGFTVKDGERAKEMLSIEKASPACKQLKPMSLWDHNKKQQTVKIMAIDIPNKTHKGLTMVLYSKVGDNQKPATMETMEFLSKYSYQDRGI